MIAAINGLLESVIIPPRGTFGPSFCPWRNSFLQNAPAIRQCIPTSQTFVRVLLTAALRTLAQGNILTKSGWPVGKN